MFVIIFTKKKSKFPTAVNNCQRLWGWWSLLTTELATAILACFTFKSEILHESRMCENCKWGIYT